MTTLQERKKPPLNVAPALGALNRGAQRLRQPAGTAAERSAAASILNWTLPVLAGLTFWVFAFGGVISALAEHHDQHGLYVTFRQEVYDGVAPLGGAMKEGKPVALLESSTGGLDQLVVVEGSSASDLRSGPGHLPGTPLPGQPGAVVIMGRSVSYGHPFGRIAQFHAGDKIIATTGEGQYTYVVEDVRRPGDLLPQPLPAGGSQLTLVTSEGSGWRAGWAPSHAIYVDAVLQGKAAAGAATTGAPRPADAVMTNDTGGLYEVLLWLQLLIGVSILILLGRRKWGAWQVWLVGMPLLLAALWGVTNSAWPLLPNLV